MPPWNTPDAHVKLIERENREADRWIHHLQRRTWTTVHPVTADLAPEEDRRAKSSLLNGHGGDTRGVQGQFHGISSRQPLASTPGSSIVSYE